MSRNTFATIDVRALDRNLARVRALADGARIMAVVKADAYGHGLRRCLPALLEADMLAVATMDEARASMERSLRWAERSKTAHDESPAALFGGDARFVTVGDHHLRRGRAVFRVAEL